MWLQTAATAFPPSKGSAPLDSRHEYPRRSASRAAADVRGCSLWRQIRKPWMDRKYRAFAPSLTYPGDARSRNAPRIFLPASALAGPRQFREPADFRSHGFLRAYLCRRRAKATQESGGRGGPRFATAAQMVCRAVPGDRSVPVDVQWCEGNVHQPYIDDKNLGRPKNRWSETRVALPLASPNGASAVMQLRDNPNLEFLI